MNNIVFGITTYNSIDFVSKNLDIIMNEIKNTSFSNKEVVISSNGVQNYNHIEQIVNNIRLKYQSIKITLINSKEKGKNKALNKILLYCCNNDICYFLDDDVIINSQTIESNINCLILQRTERNIPVLVGPNFKASNRKNASLFQKIISVPYRIDSPNSPFVMGGALTFFKKDFKLYSEDENIADDGYIGNYFLKYLFDNNLVDNTSNIIKDDIAYFHLSDSYKNWKKQQIRILMGVDNSYKCFGNKYKDYFKTMCKWEYSFGMDLRKPIKRTFSLIIYRVLQYLVMRELLNSPTTEVQWENISSTKEL